MKTKTISFVALFTAFLCILAPLSLPIGPVPISLATLGVYIIGSLLDYKRAPIVVFVYILIGAIGLPVFSSYAGGLAKLVGPTGGYIIGYLFCVTFQSIVITLFKQTKWIYPVSMVVGTLLIYIFGTAWFMVAMDGKYTLASACMACIVPFLPGDIIKIIIASIIGIKFRKTIDTYLGIPYEKEKPLKEELKAEK